MSNNNPEESIWARVGYILMAVQSPNYIILPRDDYDSLASIMGEVRVFGFPCVPGDGLTVVIRPYI